jgi:hypothetical protein
MDGLDAGGWTALIEPADRYRGVMLSRSSTSRRGPTDECRGSDLAVDSDPSS